jgi:hypothetical protein
LGKNVLLSYKKEPKRLLPSGSHEIREERVPRVTLLSNKSLFASFSSEKEESFFIPVANR